MPRTPKPKPLTPIFFPSAKQFRSWLARNHDKEREIWLAFAKRGSGRKTLTYHEALDEAICFGWIDTLVKRLDDAYYVRCFVPRKRGSKWSEVNLEHFDRLEAEGRMTEAGRAARPASVKPPPPRHAAGDPVPEFIERELTLHPVAHEFFHNLAPGYRRNYIRWITEAKREETRLHRLQEAVKKLEAGVKPSM